MSKLKVVVCGTKFGKYYIKAIENLSEEYELVGILSRGSDNSKKCAKMYNVPLYTDVKQITKDKIDVACVVIKSTVIGGQGTNISLQLLKKGIHVIQEHPVHYDDFVKCLKVAKANKCKYKINSFYPNVDSVYEFLKVADRVRKKSDLIYVDASCSIQVLFPLIDILGRALGGFSEYKFNVIGKTSNNDPFFMLGGEIKGIPITIRIFNQMDPKNPESNINLLHRIVIGSNIGTLYLTDTLGSVLWNPCIKEATTDEGLYDIDREDESLNFEVSEIVNPTKVNTFHNLYKRVWPRSIERSLMELKQNIIDNDYFNQLTQYYLKACRVWNDVGKLIGTVDIVNTYSKEPLTLKKLFSDCITNSQNGGKYE
ncbi:thiazolinyl imide reductase [Clostridium sporogenes]|uniref:Gfo/Idh/MocA family oxidoreductase n=1 Tax=Clostridium sp. LCP25S3_F10 TaxID=3438750 RepID=UPI0013D87091|nr:thiazolinyl imide reductase [Clostridium sporogenes]NFS25367.1 thiazolinyl imide reductase [Clostridium sporogenes]